MLKEKIKYVDYFDNEREEEFFFNLTKPELLEMEISDKDGMSNVIQRIVETEKSSDIMELFKAIILKAYGERSEDGRRFIKNDKLREEFSQHAAYEALFMKLASDSDAAARFINGVIPSDLAELAAQQNAGGKGPKAPRVPTDRLPKNLPTASE